MTDKNIEMQAKIYVYDLENCAREFGFKPDETWEVGMATANEKTALEKKYFPTLSAKFFPEMLAGMLFAVKFKLSQHLPGQEKGMQARIQEQELQYLVAYNPGRQRH